MSDLVIKQERIVNPYRRYEKWKPRRWAWEFLIRNNDFQTACESVERGQEVASAVAERFALQTFKDYREPFSSRQNGRSFRAPKFLVNAISVNDYVTAKAATVKRIQLKLRYGQVAIVFDVSNGLTNARGLDHQLARARKSLLKRAQFFPEVPGISTSSTLNRAVFLGYLQLLDRLATEKTARATFRSLSGDTDLDAINKIRDSKRKSLLKAIYYAKYGYVDIPLMS